MEVEKLADLLGMIVPTYFTAETIDSRSLSLSYADTQVDDRSGSLTLLLIPGMDSGLSSRPRL